jgi:hypothetical protein
MKPQVRALVAQDAFELFAATDQILTGLRAVVEENGRGKVISIMVDKNTRIDGAASELKNGNAEALVARVNEITPEHEKNVQPLTGQMMIRWMDSKAQVSKWEDRVKGLRLLGTFLMAVAFILREVKEYSRDSSSAKG